MRAFFVATAVLISPCGCAEPDPSFGDPNGIIGKKLPNEPATSTEGGGVFGAPYSATTPPPPTTTLRAAHAAKSQPAPDVVTECLACHGATAAGTTPTWAFGGRIVDSAGAPATNADVVVVQGTTKIGPVKSDADGFFWAPASSGTVATGARVYVRKESSEQQMGGQLQAGTGGACDSTAGCHGGTSGPGKVHL